MVDAILPYRSRQSSDRKCNKNKASYLQPELADNSGEVTKRRPRPGQNSTIGPGALHLLSCDSGCDA